MLDLNVEKSMIWGEEPTKTHQVLCGGSWIKELCIKPDTLKLIEEKVRKSLEHMSTGGKFLNRTPNACVGISRIIKWDLMILQSFCKAKDIVNKTKSHQQIGKTSLPCIFFGSVLRNYPQVSEIL
jgi:hypothetical protein